MVSDTASPIHGLHDDDEHDGPAQLETIDALLMGNVRRRKRVES
jgi:hypothetical protein